MQYISVKNIEKYQPSYKDGRNLVWLKWHLDSLSDYKFSKLSASQRWLLIGITILETKERKPIPFDTIWLCKMLNYNKSCISKDINALCKLDLLVTECDEMSQDVTLCALEKIREDKKREDKILVNNQPLEKIFSLWNDFAEETNSVHKIRELSDKRKKKLSDLSHKQSFKDFGAIIEAIKEQPFLMGKNKRGWKVSFDWLIENDNNYVKILERRYKDDADDIPEYLREFAKQ